MVLRFVDDRGVERVERVEPELELTAAARAEVPRDGEVDRVIRAADHVVAARFQADAVVGRSRTAAVLNCSYWLLEQPLPGSPT